MTGAPIARRGARVLVIDRDDCVLLIHEREYDRPDETYWLTPGGGIDPGESPQQAAAREVFEETGLRVAIAADAPAIHVDRRQWGYAGNHFDQTNEYFAARVAGRPTLQPAAPTALESATLVGFRWWSVTQLRESDERFYPPEIADVADRAIALLPPEPVSGGVA